MKKPLTSKSETWTLRTLSRIAVTILLAFFASPFSFGSSEQDKRYAFETIGFLRSIDNIDGLFAEYTANTYRTYFNKAARFTFVDLSKTDSIFSHSKLSYRKILEDRDILAQIAKTTHTELLLRTKIQKEGSQYTFVLSLLHAPKMEIVALHRFRLEEPRDGSIAGMDFVSEPLQENLDLLFAKIPFIGQVTGRDNASVTINLGKVGPGGKVKPGDQLVIATLEDIKLHPLLKTAVEWNLVRVGKVVVEQVEDGLSFCRILEEEPGRQIGRYQKVTDLMSAGIEVKTENDFTTESPLFKNPSEQIIGDLREPDNQARLGRISLSLPVGATTWQTNPASGSATPGTLSGGGITPGGNADAQFWFTRKWYAEGAIGFNFWNLSQQNSTTGTQTPASLGGGVSATGFSGKVAAGYSHFFSAQFSGPSGWIKAGYKTVATKLPTSASELTGPITFESLFIGLGGDLPILDNWGLRANFDYGAINSVSQFWITGSTSGVTDAELSLAGYYRFDPRMAVRLGFNIRSIHADFAGGQSVDQKNLSVTPELTYYF